MTEGEGLGEEGEEKGDRNVILWADHRAEEEAALINKTGEGVLGFVGGVMSVSTANRGGRMLDDGDDQDRSSIR